MTEMLSELGRLSVHVLFSDVYLQGGPKNGKVFGTP